MEARLASKRRVCVGVSDHTRRRFGVLVRAERAGRASFHNVPGGRRGRGVLTRVFVVYLIRSLITSTSLALDEVLDDLDQSKVEERRRHEGELENIQQAEEPVDT